MKLDRGVLMRWWCVLLVLAEVPPLYTLGIQGQELGVATPWFHSAVVDGKPPLRYLYISVIVLLVLSRAFTAYLPRHQGLAIYTAVLHAAELFFFLRLSSSSLLFGGGAIGEALEGDGREGKRKFMIAMMAFNAAVFGLHAEWIGRQRRQVLQEQKETRAKDLRHIREMRAAYKREKERQKREKENAETPSTATATTEN